MTAENECETRATEELTIHPLLADCPMLAEEHTDYQAIKRSIEENGIRYPLLVNEHNQVVDGRHRVRAATSLKIAKVPVLIVQDHDAANRIWDGMVARRNLFKWQVCYQLAPMLEEAAQAGIKRRATALKTCKNPNDSRKPLVKVFGRTFSDFYGPGLAEKLAEIGISGGVYDRVRMLRKAFAEHPELKARFEPRLFTDDPKTALDLGGAMKAVGGLLGWENNPPDLKKDRGDHAGLIRKWLSKTAPHFKHWEKLSSKEKAETTETVVEVANTWPADVRKALRTRLGK